MNIKDFDCAAAATPDHVVNAVTRNVYLLHVYIYVRHVHTRTGSVYDVYKHALVIFG